MIRQILLPSQMPGVATPHWKMRWKLFVTDASASAGLH
jgi:hypothetical protein